MITFLAEKGATPEKSFPQRLISARLNSSDRKGRLIKFDNNPKFLLFLAIYGPFIDGRF